MASTFKLDPIISTTRGNLNIYDCAIGDTVYGFNNSTYTIRRFIDIPMDHTFCITYSDGRTQLVNSNDQIFTGKHIIPIIEFENNYNIYMNDYINQPQILFDKIFNNKLDPYAIGAFIINGDKSDEYINLHSDTTAVLPLLAYKYKLTYANKLSSGRRYFAYIGKEDEPIRWKDLFNGYDFNNENIASDIIFNEILFTSVCDRWKFIRGVFDSGFRNGSSKNSVSISARTEDELKSVQKVLLSLGILSKIEYNPNIYSNYNDSFILQLVGTHCNYPGMFYDIDNIENMIINMKPDQFKLQISKIDYSHKAYTRNIIFDTPNVMYIDENFLPKISY